MNDACDVMRCALQLFTHMMMGENGRTYGYWMNFFLYERPLIHHTCIVIFVTIDATKSPHRVLLIARLAQSVERRTLSL